MAGVRPLEGQNAVAMVVDQGATRASDMIIGLWRGTWSGELDVTYAEASARFTKVTALGLTEQPLEDANAVIAPASNQTSTLWPVERFTAGAGVSGEVVNGVYIAMVVDGTTYLRVLERDAIERTLDDGEWYDVVPGLVKT